MPLTHAPAGCIWRAYLEVPVYPGPGPFSLDQIAGEKFKFRSPCETCCCAFETLGPAASRCEIFAENDRATVARCPGEDAVLLAPLSAAHKNSWYRQDTMRSKRPALLKRRPCDGFFWLQST